MGKWVISCNPNYYNVIGAFDIFDRIDWNQIVDIQVGDIVYIYVGKPTGAIKFETIAVKVNKPNATIDDREFSIHSSENEKHERYMELELLRSFDDRQLSYNVLMEHGLKTVRGPSRITKELNDFILKVTEAEKKLIRGSISLFSRIKVSKKSVRVGIFGHLSVQLIISVFRIGIR